MKRLMYWYVSFAYAVILLITLKACKKQEPTIPQPPVITTKPYNSPITIRLFDKSDLVKSVVADTLTEIAAGVKQTTINYIDNLNKPMRLFIIEVDLNTQELTIKAGTPDNKTQYSRQVVSEIARTQDTVGSRVLAAINGDYFNVTTGEPQSIIYKNGIAIKPLFRLCALCTFFSIDIQNTPMIVSKERVSQIDSSKIRDAVGGYHWLVRNSEKVPQGDPSVEPRTAVGVTANKIVYFVVVDGRKADYSNGMSFGQLSNLFFALGVKDAINLDGGGSSTLVVKEGAAWRVRNRPSDGVERRVANGLTIVSAK